jgi:hypothetical protein
VVAKTFFNYVDFAPAPYITVSPADQYSNINLDKISFYLISQELSYQTAGSLSRLIVGYYKFEEYHSLDTVTNPLYWKLENSDGSLKTPYASFEETLFFSENDKIEFQVYVRARNYDDGKGYINKHGAMVRMLNTVGKFDLFNEFIVKEKASGNTANGYDYNIGLIYNINHDLKINIKGENIFDSGYEQSFLDQVNLSTGRASYVKVPVTQRKFLFGMEFAF